MLLYNCCVSSCSALPCSRFLANSHSMHRYSSHAVCPCENLNTQRASHHRPMVRRKFSNPVRAIRASSRETRDATVFYPSIVLNAGADIDDDGDARVCHRFFRDLRAVLGAPSEGSLDPPLIKWHSRFSRFNFPSLRSTCILWPVIPKFRPSRTFKVRSHVNCTYTNASIQLSSPR